MAHCATCVNKVYNGVIEDVIGGVREFFLDEGLDEQVLGELRQLWEQKLSRANVIDSSEPGSAAASGGGGGGGGSTTVATASSHHQNHHSSSTTQQQSQQSQPREQQQQQALSGQQAQSASTVVTNLVPVQITVPAQQAGGVPKTITIHVPSTALANGVAGQQLQAILSSHTAAQTFALEASRAAEIIQRKLNQALEENGITLPPQLQQYNHVNATQVDGPCDEQLTFPSTSKQTTPTASSTTATTHHHHLHHRTPLEHTVTIKRSTLDALVLQRLSETQVDGAYGTGDSSSEISDDDDDDDDDKDEDEDKKSLDGEEEEEEADGPEDEPLNSEDDVSEDDNTDMFDTDNVVVCQYDKITRVRNKWKFTLKDGIMNLRGKDYVFQKATGEGEW